MIKRTYIKLITLIFIMTLTTSCSTSLTATMKNKQTGYFVAKNKATIIQSIEQPRDSVKKLLVLGESEYFKSMAKNLNFFDTIITYEELERKIVEERLQDKIPSLNGVIGLSNAANYYKPFYVLYVERKKVENKWYAELKLLNAKTGKDVFISEIYLNLMWDAHSDKGTYNPLFNSLIDYLNSL